MCWHLTWRVSSATMWDYGHGAEDRKMLPLLTAGFRPFFLAAAGWAALAMAAWLPMLTGELDLPTSFDPLSWHVQDRKSTRLNSSHTVISYAVFCLKKKKKTKNIDDFIREFVRIK